MIREAYRLEKPSGLSIYLNQSPKSLHFAVQYIGKQPEAVLPYLREKMILVFKKLHDETARLDS